MNADLKRITQETMQQGSLFDEFYEVRDFHGFYQFRGNADGPWQFVINGFCFDDIHCHVRRWDKSEAKVSIDQNDKILINGRRYGREHWYH